MYQWSRSRRHPRDPTTSAPPSSGARQQVALLPRGGGTSLTGQTVNRALVLDFTQHMNQVLDVNTDELWRACSLPVQTS